MIIGNPDSQSPPVDQFAFIVRQVPGWVILVVDFMPAVKEIVPKSCVLISRIENWVGRIYRRISTPTAQTCVRPGRCDSRCPGLVTYVLVKATYN